MEKVILEIRDRKNNTSVMKLLGTDVTVCEDIPFEDKLKCATELAIACLIEDNNGIYFRTASECAMIEWMRIKWYTNAMISDASISGIHALFDSLLTSEEYDEVVRYTNASFSCVIGMYENIFDYLKSKADGDKHKNLLEGFISSDAVSRVDEASALNEWFLDLMAKADMADGVEDHGLVGISDRIKRGNISFAKKNK